MFRNYKKKVLFLVSYKNRCGLRTNQIETCSHSGIKNNAAVLIVCKMMVYCAWYFLKRGGTFFHIHWWNLSRSGVVLAARLHKPVAQVTVWARVTASLWGCRECLLLAKAFDAPANLHYQIRDVHTRARACTRTRAQAQFCLMRLASCGAVAHKYVCINLKTQLKAVSAHKLISIPKKAGWANTRPNHTQIHMLQHAYRMQRWLPARRRSADPRCASRSS